MRPVIYQIIIEGGSRTYIGSARHFAARKRQHLYHLRKGNHHCRALQRAVAKHGLDAISWKIVENVEDASLILEQEQFWLDRLAGKLYNKSPTAINYRLSCKLSDADRARISAGLRGNSHRAGIPHPKEDRAKISAGVKRAIAEGRKTVNLAPENLAAYNAALKAKQIPHWRSNPDRDLQILAAFQQGKKMREIGAEHGITKGAVSCVIRRLLNPPKGKWSKR